MLHGKYVGTPRFCVELSYHPEPCHPPQFRSHTPHPRAAGDVAGSTGSRGISRASRAPRAGEASFGARLVRLARALDGWVQQRSPRAVAFWSRGQALGSIGPLAGLGQFEVTLNTSMLPYIDGSTPKR